MRTRPGPALARLLAALLFVGVAPAVHAAARTVVAVGASNTSGWGVGEAAAYPARLEALLRGRGLDVQVINAGRPFDTTGGMLGRLDDAVPPNADLVVLQPGANDLRFFGNLVQRTANIEAMVAHLAGRGIRAIVYDPVFPDDAYQWDRIHINREGHVRIAEDLLPQVVEALDPPPTRTGKSRTKGRDGGGPGRPR